ncbi:MAG: hypothetical protein HYX92_21060 [Chloroflexi bacterium]|nr:hypothetical protein [Chloroflexota bacterium]
MELKSARIGVKDYEAAVEEVYSRRWTDGLPVVLPTEDKVREALEYLGRDPGEVIGTIGPRNGIATVEKIAINCVMGGCLPEHVPVVIAALEAMLAEDFNLSGLNTTTHNAAPITVVSGPIVKELGFGYGDGVFYGSGSRANGAVGRAIRLIRWNIGGGFPGDMDRSTLGHPGEYAFCIAENQEDNPWEPIHVERGLKPEDSAVTVFGGEAPSHVSTGSGSAMQVLMRIGDAMAKLGSNNLHAGGNIMIVIGPRAAAVLAQESYSKEDVRTFLFENARKPAALVALTTSLERRKAARVHFNFPKWVNLEDPTGLIPVARRKEDIVLVVAGGWGAAGAFCAVLHGWGHYGGWVQTRKIERPGNRDLNNG